MIHPLELWDIFDGLRRGQFLEDLAMHRDFSTQERKMLKKIGNRLKGDWYASMPELLKSEREMVMNGDRPGATKAYRDRVRCKLGDAYRVVQQESKKVWRKKNG